MAKIESIPVKAVLIPMTILKRTRWLLRNLDANGYGGIYGENKLAPVPEPDINKANLVGSLLTNGNHGPCIDLDYPCRLYPSRTPGHFHLYLEKEVTWDRYEPVLKAMADAGLIEQGYYKSAASRQQTFLRPPNQLAAPACTTVPSEPSEILALIDMVRALVGTGPPHDELDQKIESMEGQVYSMMAAKLDEIVARRASRGTTAVPSETVPERSDDTDGAAGPSRVRRLRPSRRRD
jgi:hypothetical protein